MEKIENEKIYRIILAIFTAFSISIIALFCFFFIGLSKVDAALPINFTDSEYIRVTNGTSAVNLGTIIAYCTDNWGCSIPPTEWTSATALISNFTRIDSNVANESYLFISGNNYTIKFEYSLFKTANIDSTMKPSMAIYSSGTWVLATCDSGQSYSSSDTYYEENNEYNTTYRQDFVYSCDRLDVTVNGNTFRTGVIATGGFAGTTRFAQYLMLTDNSRPGNSTEEIINNDNVNTDKIINNQNQNQQQTNQGLQDIEDAILDSSQPNLDNFNYTDSTGGLISTFLTMPITLLRVMNNVDTCRSITLGELFGTPLRFDCINPGVFLGETLWTIIDYFVVFTMIISISQLFIYVYEKFKNLDDFFNEFYTPQHMAPDEYIPKHGGGK